MSHVSHMYFKLARIIVYVYILMNNDRLWCLIFPQILFQELILRFLHHVLLAANDNLDIT